MRRITILGLAALLGACSPSQPVTKNPPQPSATPVATTPATGTQVAPAEPSADAKFAALAARFLKGYLEREPVAATQAGDHTNDAKWPDVSTDGEAEHRRFIESMRADLAALDPAQLSTQNRVDAAILKNQLDAWVFSLDEMKPAVRSPLFYTGLIGDGIDPLVTRDFAPLAERMKNLRARLLGVPAIVEVAKKRLADAPRVFTETAIQQNHALVDLAQHGLADEFAKVPEQRADLEAAAKAAAAALADFQTFLEKDLLARSNGSFRVGKERFAKTLHFQLEDDVDPDELVKTAKETLAKTQDEMAETAKELWPTVMKGPLPKADTPETKKALVKKVLDKLADDRPTNKTIVDEAKKLLVDATKFVAEKDLVRVPDEPCQVIEMPEYKRGIAIAYCESSGPLEKKQETFYAISPTPKDWPEKRALSFYREYNRSMLADLTVHEAMPGHYLQAMHANRFHSDVRAVFGNGAFVEGWAVYGEWLMTKHGFGGPKVRLQRLKMLARVCANTILDHGIHAEQMDEREALDFMTREAFQEEGEAVAKWRRARLTSGQLSTYFYGFREFAKLRAENETKPGFAERAYHDRLLAFGAPAMRYLRGLVGAQ